MILGDNPGTTAIVNALPESLSVSVHGDIVTARSETFEWMLRSVWIGEGYPNDYLRRRDVAGLRDVTDVITARRISKGTRSLLASAHESWADLTGRARMTAEPGLFVERGPIERSVLDSQGQRWSDSAGAAAETILSLALPDVRHVSDSAIIAAQLAEITGYSYPQTNKVLQQFEAAGYIAKLGTERGTNARRVLRDPSRLLADWVGWHSSRKPYSVELHTLWRESERSIDLLRSRVRGQWVASGWWAADQMAPFSTAIPNVSVYLPKETFQESLANIARGEEVEIVERDGRISLYVAEPHVLALATAEPRGSLASPVRVYGDLMRIGNRGEEAAQHLREFVFGF